MPPKYRIGNPSKLLAEKIVEDKYKIQETLARDPVGFEMKAATPDEIQAVQNQDMLQQAAHAEAIAEIKGQDPQPTLTPTVTTNKVAGESDAMILEREKLATAKRIADLLERISSNRNANPNTGRMFSNPPERMDEIQRADTLAGPKAEFNPAPSRNALANEPSAERDARKPGENFAEFGREQKRYPKRETGHVEYFGAEPGTRLGRVMEGVRGALSSISRW